MCNYIKRDVGCFDDLLIDIETNVSAYFTLIFWAHLSAHNKEEVRRSGDVTDQQKGLYCPLSGEQYFCVSGMNEAPGMPLSLDLYIYNIAMATSHIVSL